MLIYNQKHKLNRVPQLIMSSLGGIKMDFAPAVYGKLLSLTVNCLQSLWETR